MQKFHENLHVMSTNIHAADRDKCTKGLLEGLVVEHVGAHRVQTQQRNNCSRGKENESNGEGGEKDEREKKGGEERIIPNCSTYFLSPTGFCTTKGKQSE